MIQAPTSKLDISAIRRLLAVDTNGRPRRRDARAILGAIRRLADEQRADMFEELVLTGLLRGCEDRYSEYVKPQMIEIGAARFKMGSADSTHVHFSGESPRHLVELAPFAIAATPVTNGLYRLIDPRHDFAATDGEKPVTGVSWFDAALFALWVGSWLPTEAQWEYACGAGSSAEWCCAREEDLPTYAWFSENALGELHRVGTREPNELGLFDCHGNVWEWCADAYDQDFYARSPLRDPLCGVDVAETGDRSCRGGSHHALAEMCRTRYRFHEPADFWAHDLGFRLARSARRPFGGE